MRRLTNGRIAVALTALALVAAGAAGVAAAGGDTGKPGATPTSTSGAPDAIQVAAAHALADLVSQGVIDASQAAAVQQQVDAGSVDPGDLVSRGVVTDAQMQAVANALDQVKQRFATGG